MSVDEVTARPAPWLVTGAHGMLGRDLVALLTERGIEVTVTDVHNLDITDAAATKAAVAGHELVINAAAWTNVDAAESSEPAATRINGDGPANLAAACAAHGTRMIHISTDYVFSGVADAPYPEDHPTGPVSAYGRSKLAGEQAVLRALPRTGYLARTAWLYGVHGRNFVATMLRLADERETLDVVDDQRGQPTWTGALAERLYALGLAALVGDAPAGVYHATASGQTTWFGLARAVFTAAGLDPQRVRPTTSDRYPSPARRPAYSVLGHERWREIGMAALPDWHEQLSAALPAIIAHHRTSRLGGVE